MPRSTVKNTPLPQERRARAEYARIPTRSKADDPASYSKTPHAYGDILISGGKLGGPLQRDIIYWIERKTWGTNTSRNPATVTRPEWAKLSITALAKLCQVWDEEKRQLRPVERKNVAIALADLERRGIVEARERKGCGKTTAKMYKLTPERWKAAKPYTPPEAKEIAAAELEADETEEAEATAGPEEPTELQSTVHDGKVSRPQALAVSLGKDGPAAAVTIRLSYCPQGFDSPVTFRSRTGRNGRVQIFATPHRPGTPATMVVHDHSYSPNVRPPLTPQPVDAELVKSYSDFTRSIVRQFWDRAADKALINQIVTAAQGAPVECFWHVVALKFRFGVGKHTPGLLIKLATDAGTDYRDFMASENARIAARGPQKEYEPYDSQPDAPAAPAAAPGPACGLCQARGTIDRWVNSGGVYGPRPVRCTRCHGTGRTAQ